MGDSAPGGAAVSRLPRSVSDAKEEERCIVREQSHFHAQVLSLGPSHTSCVELKWCSIKQRSCLKMPGQLIHQRSTATNRSAEMTAGESATMVGQ